jgi:hypothetical protein
MSRACIGLVAVYKLFVETTATSRAQADAIQAESARYNIGPILRTVNMSIRAAIDVSYKSEPGLDLLVPGEMRELYLLRLTESRIDGRAEYSRFRRFTVTTEEKTKPPGG